MDWLSTVALTLVLGFPGQPPVLLNHLAKIIIKDKYTYNSTKNSRILKY
jgi:hypothetical protein